MDLPTRGCRSGARAIVAGAALAALAGCTTPATDVYGADCKPRDIRRVESHEESLSEAVARQASVNRTYRECLERRGVRVAR